MNTHKQVYNPRVLEYQHLQSMDIFRVDGELFIKQSNSHSINAHTGKDAVFALQERVVSTGRHAIACRV